jgi:hypothetical protein
MPFSPLIGVSFLFHLVFALADMGLSAWKRSARRKKQLARRKYREERRERRSVHTREHLSVFVSDNSKQTPFAKRTTIS